MIEEVRAMSHHEQEERVEEEAEEVNAAADLESAGIAPATLSREERSRKLQESSGATISCHWSVDLRVCSNRADWKVRPTIEDVAQAESLRTLDSDPLDIE